MQHVRVGAQPINWINDDFKDLGADITLARCLSEMREAGYEGSELGHRFPDDAGAVRRTLECAGLVLVSGWHSTYLAERPLDVEIRRFDAHAEKLWMCGCDVVIVAECTGAIHGDGRTPLRFGSQRGQLAGDAWRRVCDGLDLLARRAAQRGMKVAYHEHMGTAVQSAEDVDALMAETRSLSLLLDTGHLHFAGADPLPVLRRHAARVAHVHLKNVRATVVDEARTRGFTFEQAVRAGVFTVPGDAAGAIDYAPVFAELARTGYRGWLVVEAEQDPRKANPFEYAKRARAFVRELMRRSENGGV